MAELKVTYLGTEILDTWNTIDDGTYEELRHQTYVIPEIKLINKKGVAALTITIYSLFECTTLPFALITQSKSRFDKFTVINDKYGLIEDCIFLAFEKHLELLSEELPDQELVDRINDKIDEDQYKNSLETMLYLARKGSGT